MTGSSPPLGPESGVSLVELATSLAILSVVALSVGFSLVSGVRHRRESFQIYQGLSAMRDLVAEIQINANRPQDLANQEGIAAVYDRYNGQTINVPSLPSGQIVVTCFANEASVPAVLGGTQDLNFDGDAADDLANASNGTDLKIVPITLTLTLSEGNFAHSFVVHRLITVTEDGV